MTDRINVSGMKPSDALEKLVELHPEVPWDWTLCRGHCAMTMLVNFAEGINKKTRSLAFEFALDPVFPSLAPMAGREISQAARLATSWPEAIAALRERGW